MVSPIHAASVTGMGDDAIADQLRNDPAEAATVDAVRFYLRERIFEGDTRAFA
ncbi:MAG: hypothetical protein KDB27_21585 [Planctomycetales bacterium]|nr:hypothetical protein [Planctomycetales bacterium]